MLMFSIVSGQSLLDKKISADVCSCIDKGMVVNKKMKNSDIMNCFMNAMASNKESIVKECMITYGDTTEENGHKCAQAFVERNMISLVHVCKSYFLLADSLRYDDYKYLDRDSLLLKLKNLNLHESKIDKSFLSVRAVLNFELKKYGDALSDIDKILSMDPNDTSSILLKAWINELQGNYSESIFLYNKLAELSKNNAYYIFSEIVKRKKNGL